jgi:hypothetical protein
VADGLAVFEGIDFANAKVNTSDAILLAHVTSSIRRGYPQVWPVAPHGERVAIVGGGPSLAETFDELRALYFEGVKIVTVNGAYHWCLERNIRPSAQIVVDARAHNARFVQPDVPRCRYYLASQCHPAMWDAVAGREFVAIYHDPCSEDVKAALDAYYLGHWSPMPGGTTVGTRAIALLRRLGYLRMDLFGFDSCWLDDQHHGYTQPENDRDQRLRVTVSPLDAPDLAQDFFCASWHLKQAEDLIAFIRASGHQFKLAIHGRGLLAFLLRSAAADVTVTPADQE